ncbi:MAG: M20 family metallopeptidase [Deinococcota bacterium]|jgi:succinyl-diaminopimelate desuccinylase|nr:M20 family metallopeptidase [Deinococcota bacterium]
MDLDSLTLTQALIRFDTINPPGNERPCAEFLARPLGEAGYDISLHDYGPDRSNLVARLSASAKPGSSSKPPLCFSGHIDTVPLGQAAWTRPPFGGEVDNGRLFGRGASDMKSGVAALILAALRLAKLERRASDVLLIITAGEESGCTGAAYLAEQPGLLGKAGALVVAEPTSNQPLVGHKGALWLRAKTAGVTAHGSMPERGVNAVFKAAQAIVKLGSYAFDVPGHPVMGAPSLNVGTVLGGMNVNSVPDSAEIGIDIRTVAGQDNRAVLGHLQAYLGDEVGLEPFVDVGSVYSDPDEPWLRQVFAVVEALLGQQTTVQTAPYFTDASVLTPALGHPPTVILGPGEPSMAHQTDEYCFVDKIAEAVEAYTRIGSSWLRD